MAAMTAMLIPGLEGEGQPRLVDAPVLDIVVPVFNEEHALEASIRRLHDHLVHNFPFSFRITIVDNASTDRTDGLARALAYELPHVSATHLDQKGRGRALRSAWSASDAQVLAYMDVDLSTDLAALLPLVAPLVSGHSDLAIGTRLAPGSRVVRGTKRELISRTYNLILRRTMAARFSDAQCGFKAIRRDVAEVLLPLIEDNGWFFDTEMLVLAQRSGLRVHEVPVDWIDDPDSRVDIVATAIADLRGVARLAKGFVRGSIPVGDVRRRFGRDALAPAEAPPTFARQLGRFAAIGVASTAAYALLFLVLRTWSPAQVANVVALLVTATANTAANRRLTFGVRGADDALRHHAQALMIVGLGLVLTTAALAALHQISASPARWVELTVLIVANLVTTVIRFLGLRLWVFATHRADPIAPIAPEGTFPS
jgi:putative flippase GtrA